MTKLRGAALALTCAIATACTATHAGLALAPASAASTLTADLDALFETPPFDTALWSARVETLDMYGAAPPRVLYERNARSLVMPASNMKIVTMAAAAELLGWDHRFETTLAIEGDVRDGVLHGDVHVIGGGDPSISPSRSGQVEAFDAWIDALRDAGINRIAGRIIGNDDIFDDQSFGEGWAWDNLPYGYAAQVSGLQFSENIAVLRVTPGAAEGDPATITAEPQGHGLVIEAAVTTGPAASRPWIALARAPGSTTLKVTGNVPAGAAPMLRTAAVLNPTQFFVEAFRLALVDAGIAVDGEAVDSDAIDLDTTASAERRVVAVHRSAPLSELAAYFMKASQNLYGETFLKAIGRATSRRQGSIASGRAAISKLLASWGIEPGTYVIADGSGLSRYNELSAALVTTVLRKMIEDERHRGWFMAALPVAGYDGTLDERMTDTELQRAVQAKTGTISNARALSGVLTAPSGERFLFSIIANNFVRPSAEVDAVAEAALRRVLREARPAEPDAPRPTAR